MKKIIIPFITSVLYALIFNYLVSPAISFHSLSLWVMIITTLILFILGSLISVGSRKINKNGDKVVLISLIALGAVVFVFIVGSLFGLKMFRSSTYASIAAGRIEDRDFLVDIKEEEEISNIALMDTESAMIIGNRQMGSLSNLVSQFETSYYSTITVNNKPLKVSPLAYVNFFRYEKNKKDGIPGYIKVNPVTQKAEYVEFAEPLKYVPSAYFSHDLKRHIHSRYKDVIINSYYFELDEEEKPYYISPYYVYNAGLFGAKDVGGVIIVDPVTGEMNKYSLEEVPEWVDRVYDGDLLVEQYDWYGTLKNGFWNSLFSKVGCVVTTEDYGYKTLDNDIWVFTGVTSVSSDESNIGFVLMNSRTGNINYYDIYGAEEYSAMSAAEGQVQNLRYTASFPSIINVNDEAAYIMVLKDSGGLTKMYAIVKLQDYSIVATGETQGEALENYKAKLGVSKDGNSSMNLSITIKIDDIKYAEIDGNTFAYIISGTEAYKLSIKDNEEIMLARNGDMLQLLCEDTSKAIKNASLR